MTSGTVPPSEQAQTPSSEISRHHIVSRVNLGSHVSVPSASVMLMALVRPRTELFAATNCTAVRARKGLNRGVRCFCASSSIDSFPATVSITRRSRLSRDTTNRNVESPSNFQAQRNKKCNQILEAQRLDLMGLHVRQQAPKPHPVSTPSK